MPSTINVQATVNWCAPFLNYQPLLIGGQEPALTNANMVLQTILGAPFAWRFNRDSVAFACNVNDQDYKVTAPGFGFIEKAWLTSEDGTELHEITVQRAISASLEKARPAYISDHMEYDPDGAGKTLTLRLNVIPEQAYAGVVMFQKKAPIMTSMASRWRPIPDEFAYIFNQGFLSLTSILVNDARYPIYNQKFMSHLLAAQEGLDETQRNIFLGNWADVTKHLQRAQMQTQQGIAARQQ